MYEEYNIKGEQMWNNFKLYRFMQENGAQSLVIDKNE